MEDATRIYQQLYQGAAPPVGAWLQHRGFETVVLAAEEFQPPAERFPGVRVIHFPLDDGPQAWSTEQLAALRRLSGWLAQQVQAGRRVLVTCQEGLNRSGLIVAATIMRATGRPAAEVVRLLRSRRSGWVLCNDTFVELLGDEVSRWGG